MSSISKEVSREFERSSKGMIRFFNGVSMKIKGCFKGVFSGGKGYLKHRQWGGGQSGK